MKNLALYDKYKGHRRDDNFETEERCWNVLYSMEEKKYKNFVCLGCGDGGEVIFFRNREVPARGLDHSLENVDRIYIPSLFIQGDIKDLPFKDGTQDFYFVNNVIHFVDEEKALAEMYRTLRKDGMAFVTFNLAIIDENGKVDYEDSPSRILKAVSASGLNISENKLTCRHDFFPIPHSHAVLELLLQK